VSFEAPKLCLVTSFASRLGEGDRHLRPHGSATSQSARKSKNLVKSDRMCTVVVVVPDVVVTHKAVFLGIFDSDVNGASVVTPVYQVSYPDCLVDRCRVHVIGENEQDRKKPPQRQTLRTYHVYKSTSRLG